ncbi:MAG TPA: serine/threonine-protein kinase [Labilithrix sp.]|nr:serine/threonine-protein kinase [Labilithrix sp.]
MEGPSSKVPSTADDAEATHPRTIGRYEVECLIGQGGMGRVWLARDTVLGRKVAIKVLRDDLALPPPIRDELVVRMGHEARAAAAVSHPNIVTLYDMGEDEQLGLFLVFEYVTTKDEFREPGGPEIVLSLRDRLKRGPLPLREVATLAREVGSALSFAHEAGVIHRDVKPENILFSRTGFKIADFGIARIPDSTITRANTVLGTPAYTAPEALSKGEFGPASDQFSLAATLWEAATGVRAFGGEDAIATAGKVSSEPPPPLVDSMGPDPVVRQLDDALQRGLAKAPEERFSSCAELGQAVLRAIENDNLPRLSVTPRPLPELIEIERSPLSSRAATVERAMNEQVSVIGAAVETPLPSIYLRKRTHRVQNIAAGIALIVIVGLLVLGRRAPSVGNASASATASASVSAAPSSAPAPPPKAQGKPKPPSPTRGTAQDAGDSATAPAASGE